MVIKSVCEVNAGATEVVGGLTLAPGSILLAAYGRNHRTHHGGSTLLVKGSVSVERGATLILGCRAPELPCLDDAHPKTSKLESSDRITARLTVEHAIRARCDRDTLQPLAPVPAASEVATVRGRTVLRWEGPGGRPE